MATPQDELAEKLKALGDKPNSRFTVPPEAPTTVSDPISAPLTEPPTPITELTGDSVKIEDALKTPSIVKVDSAKGKPEEDVNPQMANLISEAEKRNAALSSHQRLDMAPDLSHVTPVFRKHSARVLQLLKDHGMDSQQAEKALTALLSLE